MLFILYILARGLKIGCDNLIFAIFLSSTELAVLRNIKKFGTAAVRSIIEAALP
jgi:hypothetical protein